MTIFLSFDFGTRSDPRFHLAIFFAVIPESCSLKTFTDVYRDDGSTAIRDRADVSPQIRTLYQCWRCVKEETVK